MGTSCWASDSAKASDFAPGASSDTTPGKPPGAAWPSLSPQACYDCGSCPTESFCGTLTARLKGRGMRWDRDNAEAVMSLGSLYYSDLWPQYWAQQRAA